MTRMISPWVGSWIILMMAYMGAHGGENPTMPDLVIVNGVVWTGVPGARPAQAIAIFGEKIIAVGTNEAVKPATGSKTQTIDAKGRLIIPGMTDSHIHVISGGIGLSRINLRDVADRDAFIKMVGEWAKNVRPGQWVLGGRWSTESWPDPASPRKEWIDPVTADVPVFLERMDGHQGLANSLALKLAFIDAKGPPDPPGGVIERDSKTGEPTGILKDDAMGLVGREIPSPAYPERSRGLKAAMKYLNSLGITAVHDLTELDDLLVYEHALKEQSFTVRVHSFLSVEDWKKHFDTAAIYPRDDAWWRMAGFKGFMDGSLGSRTAYMREPFSDSPRDSKYPRGLLLDQADPIEEFQARVAQADAAGWQPAVHAIGDQANHLLLGVYEYVGKQNAARDRRPRIEHSQHLLPEDIARFAKLGVIASMQPLHKADDGRWAEKALGAERSKTTYAFKSLLAAGARVAFGSDWPVVSANPFEGIAAAVTGRTQDGKVWVPEQNITVEQALTCYTAVPAYASYQEKRLGTLEVGKLADLVILSQNVFELAPDKIAETKADVTIVNGRVVYSRE